MEVTQGAKGGNS